MTVGFSLPVSSLSWESLRPKFTSPDSASEGTWSSLSASFSYFSMYLGEHHDHRRSVRGGGGKMSTTIICIQYVNSENPNEHTSKMGDKCQDEIGRLTSLPKPKARVAGKTHCD